MKRYKKLFKVLPCYRFYKNGYRTEFCCFGLDKCSLNDVARFYGVSYDSITLRLEDACLLFVKLVRV